MITRGRPRVGAWVLAAAVVLGVATSSCTASDAGTSPTLTPLPSTTLTTTASPTTSSTPSASPSLLVAKAGPPPKTPFTKQGAEIFASSYYLTANQAMATGKVADLTAYSLPSCPCRRFAREIADFARKGEHIEARGYRLKRVASSALLGNVVPVAVTFSLDNLRVYDSQGRLVDGTTPIRSKTNTLLLFRRGDRWTIERIIGGPQS
jgi:hypothetical protein